MPTRQSSRLLQSTNIDQDFVVDNEDAPSLNGVTIEPDDSWPTVWDKLRSVGWQWKKGNDLYDFLYLKPNIGNIKNKREGVDYFIKEEHVRKYAMIKYGWSDSRDDSSDDDSTNGPTGSSLSDNEEKDEILEEKLANKKQPTIIKKEPTTMIDKTNEYEDSNNQDASSDDSCKSDPKTHVTTKEINRNKNSSSVKVIKGSKSKPGMISFDEQNDYRIGRYVAFLLSSKEGREIKNYFNGNVPDNALETVVKNGKEKQYLIGVIDKQSKTKGRKDHYTVSWCYSCDVLHCIDLQIQIIDKGISQYLSMKNQNYSFENNDDTKNKYNKVFSTHFIDNVLHKKDEINNEGERIESDDCMSDDDGYEIDDIEIDYHVNSENNLGYNYNKIRHTTSEDISMAPWVEDKKKKSNSEQINGLKWDMNGRLNAPQGLSYRQKTKIIETDDSNGGKQTFRTELESLLAFLPLRFWVYHLNECNKYVDQLQKKTGKGSKKIAGSNWKTLNISELMTFYAILIQMVCRPSPGKRYEECWDHTDGWFTNCKHMTKTRFKQIRASLHWCDNPRSSSMTDTLYKIRPMISILEMTIGKYLKIGRETALDETTIGLYHAYAKALTFYNPNKPRGKHHCKLYVLCENDYWAAINFKFCHRSYNSNTKDNSDIKNDNNHDNPKSQNNVNDKKGKNNKKRKQKTLTKEKNNKKKKKTKIDSKLITDSGDDDDMRRSDVDTDDDEKKANEEIPIMTSIVTSLCKCLKNTGIVVNMDNLYSSPELFIKLKEMGIYARGTFRKNRKYLPKFIQFTENEVKKIGRGSYRLATNSKYNLSCYAWNDKNPVHVLSSADGTEVDTTKRRIKSSKVQVLCPSAIKRYNQGMQGVDQFNKLLTLYPLASLKFDKYYKKIAMVLLDFALTNAYLHYKIANEETMDKKYRRVTFMERLQDQMIETDWAEKVRTYDMKVPEDDSSMDSDTNEISNEKNFEELMKMDVIAKPEEERLPMESLQFSCNPVAMKNSQLDSPSEQMHAMFVDSKTKSLSNSKKACQICDFEGRGRKLNGVNYCPTHRIRACTLRFMDPRLMDFFKKQGEKQIIHDISLMDKWLCPDTSLTCWEKAHSFYIPNGLFHSTFFDKGSHNNKVNFNETAKLNLRSKLYLLRKETLKNATPRSSPLTVPDKPKPDGIDIVGTTDPLASQLATIDIMSEPVNVPKLEEDF